MAKTCSLLIVLTIFISAGFMNISHAVSNGHWADSYYSQLVDRELIDPNEFKQVDLDRFISRGDFINMLMGVFDLGEADYYERHFNDVRANSKYFSATERARKIGIIIGYDYGLFLPDELIQRQDMFTILGRALSLVYGSDFKLSGYTGDVFKDYNDKADIAEYAAEYMDDMLKLGIINGYSDGTIRPRVNVTYAETLAVIIKALDAVEVLKKEIVQKRPDYERRDTGVLPIDAEGRTTISFPEMVPLDNIVNIHIDMGMYRPKFEITNREDMNKITNFLRKLVLYSTDKDHEGLVGNNEIMTFKYNDGKERKFVFGWNEFSFDASSDPLYRETVYKELDFRDEYAFEDIVDALLRSYYRTLLEQHRQSGLPSQKGVVIGSYQFNYYGKTESRIILSSDNGKMFQQTCDGIYTYRVDNTSTLSPIGSEFELFYSDPKKTTQEVIFFL